MPKKPKTAPTSPATVAPCSATPTVMLDVRTLMELRAGKIGNAVHIDYMAGGFEEQIAKLIRQRPMGVLPQRRTQPESLRHHEEAGL